LACFQSRSLRTTIAVTPPVEVVPAANNANVAMHAGHIVSPPRLRK
jgi:hypothetical protein